MVKIHPRQNHVNQARHLQATGLDHQYASSSNKSQYPHQVPMAFDTTARQTHYPPPPARQLYMPALTQSKLRTLLNLMKIAVLLRGKQNFSKTTSTFFDTLVIKRFPKIDFKFFVHTWESLPVSPGTINSLKQITLSKSTILERIGHWKPASYELEEEKNLFDIIKNILKKQPIHNRNHTWVESQKNTLKNYELINPFFIDRSLYEYINNIDQIINDPNINNNNHVRVLRSIFSGFYLTGQMYSALKAFNLLKSYM